MSGAASEPGLRLVVTLHKFTLMNPHHLCFSQLKKQPLRFFARPLNSQWVTWFSVAIFDLLIVKMVGRVGAELEHGWRSGDERSPSTNVSRIRLPDSASCVG